MVSRCIPDDEDSCLACPGYPRPFGTAVVLPLICTGNFCSWEVNDPGDGSINGFCH